MRENYGQPSNCNDSLGNFCVGVLNPDYKFPVLPKIERLLETLDNNNDNQEDNLENIEEDEEETAEFLDKLSHCYLAHTHCSMVDFTQEEGCVVLLASVAACLILSVASIPTNHTIILRMLS